MLSKFSNKVKRVTGFLCTANMCSKITVEVQLKNCAFEKLQFFTVDHSSLYFLQVKNSNFSSLFCMKLNAFITSISSQKCYSLRPKISEFKDEPQLADT